MSSLPDSPSAERPLPAEPPAVTRPPMPAHACGTGFALQKKWESRRKRNGALQGAGGGVLGACPPLPGAHEGLPRPLGGRGHSDKAAETGLSAAPPSRSQGPRPRGAGTAFALPRVLSTRETARCPRRGGKQKGAGSIPLAPRLHRVYMPPSPAPRQVLLGLDSHPQIVRPARFPRSAGECAEGQTQGAAARPHYSSGAAWSGDCSFRPVLAARRAQGTPSTHSAPTSGQPHQTTPRGVFWGPEFAVGLSLHAHEHLAKLSTQLGLNTDIPLSPLVFRG